VLLWQTNTDWSALAADAAKRKRIVTVTSMRDAKRLVEEGCNKSQWLSLPAISITELVQCLFCSLCFCRMYEYVSTMFCDSGWDASFTSDCFHCHFVFPAVTVCVNVYLKHPATVAGLCGLVLCNCYVTASIKTVLMIILNFVNCTNAGAAFCCADS